MNIISEKQGYIGSNCYMISTEKAAVIIDAFDFTDKMRTFIDENRGKDFLILATHRHFDHVLGLYAAKKYSFANVAISHEDEVGLLDPEASMAADFHRKQTPMHADIVVGDGDVLNIGDMSISVIATPGHTKGSVCYIIDGAMFSGDTLFRLDTGRTDFPGGNSADMIESLKKLYMLDRDYTVYPGHGDPTTLYYERTYNPYYNTQDKE